jgi:polar amino acid transport system substrate-binding protein
MRMRVVQCVRWWGLWLWLSGLAMGLTGLAAGLWPGSAWAQSDNAVPQHLLVGALVAPPFLMKTTDGRWTGFSSELWQELVQVLGVEFEWREYGSLAKILDAVAQGHVDVVPAMAITERHEALFDFSHPYYQSGTAIAVPTEGTGHGWLGVVQRLFTRQILGVIGSLLLLWCVAGAVVWLCEGRRNRAMFGGGPVQGIGQGIWWAVVTMTTVGYGDTAPKTVGGRMVAMIWMLTSIMLISSLTATLTTALTVGTLRGKVRGLQDLPGVRVGSVVQSEALAFLTQHGMAVRPFASDKAGLQALVDAQLDAFVYNKAILEHLTRTEFPAQLAVLPGIFDPYYMGLALPPGSALREPLNRALLKVMTTEDWTRLITRYFGTNG